MAKSKRKVKREPRKYGIFYPEGAGYLHIDDMTPGSQGSVARVMSCADKKIYVRKQGKLIHCNQDEIEVDHGCDEVVYYRKHKLIPDLIDWTIYRPLPRSHPDYFEYCATATIWEYCPGGDLRHFMDRYANLNSYRGHIAHIYPYKYHIPEAFVWKVFGQLVQVLSFIHHAQPPLCHRDIFTGNIFLRALDDNGLPDCCLGDFGKAAMIVPNPWNAQGRFTGRVLSQKSNPSKPIARDYRAVILMIKEMMTLDYIYQTSESWADHEVRLDGLFDDLEMAHTGRSKHSTGPRRKRRLSSADAADDDREKYQSSIDDGFRRYTPLLFDTVHQLERRVGALIDMERGVKAELASNRDWSYLGEALEKKAVERLGNPTSVTYPAIDENFIRIVGENDLSVIQDGLRQQVLIPKSEIIQSISIRNPIGPFRIATLDPQTLAVTGVSRTTYNSFTNSDVEPAPEGSSQDATQPYDLRKISDQSNPHDPMQTENIIVTRRLSYGSWTQ